MKKLFAVLIMLFLGTTYSINKANAGVMFEPYLGYEKGTWKQGSSKDDYKSTYFGARLGTGMMGFAFGLDYTTGSGKKTSGTVDTDARLTDLGVFAAYQFPVLIRAYFTYSIDSKWDLDYDSNDYKGTGYKIGIGYTGLPFVAINFEMINRTFTKHGSNSLSTDLTTSGYALNISLPLP